ncbi:DUF2383 domain-containing protein [Pseudomonas peli]|uniref:DUF2383 domain-containing protein n=1 Tax=Pseudomonas peli TaxID=592361 RepID=UPI003D15B7B4
MTDLNKEAISVLNSLIETSKDGQEGFKTCAEDIKHPEAQGAVHQAFQPTAPPLRPNCIRGAFHGRRSENFHQCQWRLAPALGRSSSPW